MSRNVHAALASHLAQPATTVCYLLKIKPVALSQATLFGITTLDQDVTYDDGSGDGLITYKAKRGYTKLNVDTKSDLSVDNTEASGLLAEYAADGMTAEGIARGDYDNARFAQYLINYNDLISGHHVIINTGQVGQIKNLNNMTVSIELRSLTQILKQKSLIELTSITDRAKYGGPRNKMPLRWYESAVDTVGAESDREFTMTTVPGFTEAPGSGSVTMTNSFFFEGDGVHTTGQLGDISGHPVQTGFSVSNIKLDGVVQTPTTNYTISSTGLVTFTAPPTSGALATWDGTIPSYPDGYFVPGVVHWLTGANSGRENEIEEYVEATGSVTLVIPTREPIAPSDTLKIRRDSDKSKARAMEDGNLANSRSEPELPRGDGTSLQSPTTSA